MRKIHAISQIGFLVALAILASPIEAISAHRLEQDHSNIYLPQIHRGIQQPVLKWQRGGCYSSWCETGWYSSPAVADLDNDQQPEVIATSYSLFILNGQTGGLEMPALQPAGGRAWPDLVVADLDGNGSQEIVTAHGDGYLNVFSSAGQLLWSRQPTPGNELRSLAAADLDGDHRLELMVASTRSENQWMVYRSDGSLYSGSWPKLAGADPGYAAGCFNENIAAADLDGDGRGEIIAPSDVHYIAAFEDNGSQILANPRYWTQRNPTKFWSQVGVHVDDSVDLRGYANCGVEHRPNFANSAPTLADLDGNGQAEIVVVGNVYNCGTDPYTDLYEMPFIFNPDRSRWQTDQFNWTQIPSPGQGSAPLSEDYNRIESVMPNPVTADLDQDGYKEILFASYDGKLHAYSLDKSEHGSWPYRVYNPAEGFLRFASPPIVADLDHNGTAEVIFTTWAQIGTNATGKLIILSASGALVSEASLPAAFSGNWNGAMASPTLANIDNDTDLEIVINSAHSGVLAYDLPGSSDARVFWATGRGSYLRSGALP